MNKLFIFFLLAYHFVFAQEIKKKDIFGRNYLQYNFDRLKFLLDEEYYLTIPSTQQLRIHDAELDSLLKHRKNLEALNLVSNLKYCLMSETEETQNKKNILLTKWGNIYNQLFAKYQDVVYENEFLIDPKICVKRIQDKEFYFLQSENFLVSLKLPFKYQFQTLRNFQFQEEKSYKWKVFLFKEELPPTKDLEDYSLEDMLGFLSKTKPIPKNRVGKVFIFFLVHKYERFSPKLMLDFWDRKRGLTSQNKTTYQFKRKFLEKESESEFQILESNGELISYQCKEIVFGKNERSVGFFFIYPKNLRENYDRDFQEFSIQLK